MLYTDDFGPHVDEFGMPFYEYECSACKFYVEALQKISDPPLTKCPSCGREALQRLISAPVFRLKGSGWYETDFKSDKENKRNLADGAEPASSESDSDKKTKVRAGKTAARAAAKKVAARKVAKVAAKKPAGKTAGKRAKTPAKPVVKSAGRKTPRKKPVAKAARKKATAGKKTARKK